MPVPAWLPDWKNTAGYPTPDLRRGTTAYWTWRWEFLRRNPEYQEDWNRFTNSEMTKDERQLLTNRYCLNPLVDHATVKRPTFLRYSFSLLAPRGEGDQRVEILLAEGKALLEFDPYEIEESIDTQLEMARWRLVMLRFSGKEINKLPRDANGFHVTRRPRRGKGHHWLPEQWLKYLRILDANETGASLAEIGEILYPGSSSRNVSQSYNDDWNRAIELRDGGYRRFR